MTRTTKKYSITTLVCLAILSLCIAFAALGGSHNAFAAASVKYKVEYYAANKLNPTTGTNPNANYVYYDVNGDGAHKAQAEPYIYYNNRFNPGQTVDAVLTWKAPADGTLNGVAGGCKIILNNGKRTSTTPDGIRYAVIKLNGDGSQTFEGDYQSTWKTVAYTASAATEEDYASQINALSVKQGEIVALAINSGAKKNNTYDEATLSASFSFTPTDGEATTYTFDAEWIKAQVTALANGEAYPLNGEATAYFGWGALAAQEDYSDVVRPSEEQNDLAQTTDYEGLYFYDANGRVMNQTPSYLYYDSDGNGTLDAENEPYVYPDNRFVPSKTMNVALWWVAPENGKISVAENGLKIALNVKKRKSETPDGIRYAVILASADGSFTSLTTDLWNALSFTSEEKTEAAIPLSDVAVKKGDKLAVIVNCGEAENSTYDEASIYATISLTPDGAAKATDYAFSESYVKTHGTQLNAGKTYATGTATTKCYAWGGCAVGENSVVFYETNEVKMQDTSLSYVYYDSDGNERHDTSNETFIYIDNRFMPSKTSDTGLWWTAPENGQISIKENALMLVLNEKLRSSTSPDGIRYAVIIAGTDGSIKPLTKNLWNDLSYTPSEKTRAALTGVDGIEIKKGERLAVIVNCGGASNATYDETAIYAELSFTPEGEDTATKYTFNSSWLKEQGNAISNGTDYVLNGESTKYFGWGKAYLNKVRETFDAASAYAFGMVESNELEWQEDVQRWAVNSVCVAYHDTVNKTTGKYPLIRVQPDFGKNTAVTFTASEDCTAAITRLYLQMSAHEGIRSNVADGVRWSVVYMQIDENGEEKYYAVTDPVWTVHEHNGYDTKATTATHTDFPNVEMKAGERLMVVFDNNKITGYDTIAMQIDLQYVDGNGSLKTCNLLDEVVPNDTNTYEHWSFKYLRMGQDYSDTVIDEATSQTFESIGKIETGDLEYGVSAEKWLSYDYPDIGVYTQDNLLYVTPDENRAVAVALKIGKAGRIMIDEDTYIRLDCAGLSNGIRFRILKNDEIIYPAQNGWKYVRNDKQVSVQGIPVLSVNENDVIYFVVDAFGNSSEDATECNFVVHFAEGEDEYTESYIFSDSYADEARGGWSYQWIDFPAEKYTGVIAAKSGSGCGSTVSALSVTSLLTALAAVEIFRKRRK